MTGTRAGDIDPGALLYLLREGQRSSDDLDEILNTRSGLLGVSGTTGDVASLLQEEAQGHAMPTRLSRCSATASANMWVHISRCSAARTRSYSAAIGERSPDIRRRICRPLEPL